jgi:arabinose-5-phosphate isomerase
LRKPCTLESIDIKSIALRTVQLEAQAIAQLSDKVNDDFVKIVQLIADTNGRLIVSGIGKSAIIGQKIVATLNSTGTPSIFLHAADAIHGDLGMVQKDDVVLIISKSGESPEIKALVPLIKGFGNPIIAMVGKLTSSLAKSANWIIDTTVSKEACPNNLAPTSSTTAQLVMGDALAVALMELKGFKTEDFARYHPGGMLGKQLYLKVSDLFVQNEKPFVHADAGLREVIVEISKKRLGVTAVLGEQNRLLGIITDGDLRRMLEKSTDLSNITAKDIMSTHPKTIQADILAVQALEVLRKHDITQLLVLDGQQYAGVLHIHDLVKEGLI